MKVPPWTFICKFSSLSQLLWEPTSRFTMWQTTYIVFWLFVTFFYGWPPKQYFVIQSLPFIHNLSCVKWTFHRPAKSCLLRRLAGNLQGAENFILFLKKRHFYERSAGKFSLYIQSLTLHPIWKKIFGSDATFV